MSLFNWGQTETKLHSLASDTLARCLGAICADWRLAPHLYSLAGVEHLVVLADPFELAVHSGQGETPRLAILQLLRQAVLHVSVRGVALHWVVAVAMTMALRDREKERERKQRERKQRERERDRDGASVSHSSDRIQVGIQTLSLTSIDSTKTYS